MAEATRSVMLPVAPGGAPEESLVPETVWGAVQALKERGMSKEKVSRELGLDVKTVLKWWRRSWQPQVRAKRARRLDRFEAFVVGRAPEVGFNAVVLHRELAAQGYEGSYSTLLKYLQPLRAVWRPEEGPTVRFETSAGQQGQVGWGTTWAYLGEERVRVHIFTMVLGYSRRIFARAYRSEKLGSLLDGHERAFEHFGGRTETILYDNPRTIVVALPASSESSFTPGTLRPNRRAGEAAIRPRFCPALLVFSSPGGSSTAILLHSLRATQPLALPGRIGISI